MKNIVSLMLSICFFAVTHVQAQVYTETQDQRRPFFVKLQDGQVIQADKIQLKSPLFKSNHFLVNDSLKVNPGAVTAFQNENGYYARIQPGNSYDSFAKRTLDGPRVDRFTTTRDFYDYGYSPYGYGYGYGIPRTSRRRINFFAKDDGPLYELNYQNLVQALGDNEASMSLLTKHRKEKLMNTGVTIVGGGLLLLGSFLSVQNVPNQANPQLNVSPVFYAGAGIIGGQLIFNLFRKDKLTQAMEVYNYQTVE